MKISNVAYIICLFILISCNRDPNQIDNCSIPISSVVSVTRLVKTTDVSFELDSIQYVGDVTPSQLVDKFNILAFLDYNSNRITLYNATGGKKITTIYIPNKLHDRKIKAFKIINFDSILLYSPKGKRLVLMDSGGVIKWQYTFKETINPSFTNLPPPSPFIGNSSPLDVHGDTITCTGFLVGEHEKLSHDKRFIRIQLMMKTNQVQYDLTYPEIYRKPNWGGDHFRTVFSHFDNTHEELLISTPADHYITIVSKKNTVRSVFMGPKNPICIESYKYPKSERDKSNIKNITVLFFTNPSYKNILYDKYRNLYYRILEKPLPLSALNSKGAGVKSIKLLIYNQDFKYLGETDLPDGLSSENFIITPQSILFLNKQNTNENLALFSAYTIDR